MLQWTIEYCDELESWLDDLTDDQLKAIAKEIKLLAHCGNTLRLPHSRSLGQGLFELREQHFGYRIYYSFMPSHVIVLLCGGNKTTQAKDIALARKRLTWINF